MILAGPFQLRIFCGKCIEIIKKYWLTNFFS